MQNIEQERAEAQVWFVQGQSPNTVGGCVCVCTRHLKSNKLPPWMRSSAWDYTIKREKENRFDKMPLFTIYNKIIVQRKQKPTYKVQWNPITYKHVCKGLLSCSRRMKCCGPWGQEHFLGKEKKKNMTRAKKLSSHEFGMSFFFFFFK